MNMISTGAFLTEMDASNKQGSAAKKFAAVWEKKNAKAARAGGVSLMALSLAACGSSSSDTTSSTSTTTDTTTTTTPTAQTIVFTDKIDVLSGGDGDDQFRAGADDAEAADYVDGGAGTDTVKIFDSTATLPEMVNVEKLYIKGDVSIDVSGFTGSEVEIDAVAMSATADETLTVSSSQTVTLDSVTDATASNDTNSGGLSIATETGATSATIVLDQVGGATTTAGSDVDMDFTGSKVTTVNLTSSSSNGAATDVNHIAVENAGGAITTLNLTGGTNLHINAVPSTTTTINAADATGAVDVDAGAATGNLTFTGGSGNDRIDVGSNYNTNDTIDGGAGTDTLVINDASLTSAADANVVALNAASNIEIVGSDAGADLTVDLSKLSVTQYSVESGFTATAGASGTGSGGDGSAGNEALDADNLVDGDKIIIKAGLVGAAGGKGADRSNAGIAGDGAAGADAINLAAKSNLSANTIDLEFSTSTAVNIEGGDGGNGGSGKGTDSGGTGADGGDGLDASQFEIINIHTASKTSDITFIAGSGGVSGTGGSSSSTVGIKGDAGASVRVGKAAEITITGAGDVTLGTVVSTTANSDLTVDGSAMTGALSVTTGTGDDTLKGGSKADTLNAGAGDNTIEGGAGNDNIDSGAGDDTIDGGAGNDNINSGDGSDTVTTGAGIDTVVVGNDGGVTITDFTVGSGGDVISIDLSLTDADATGSDLVTIGNTASVGNGDTAVLKNITGAIDLTASSANIITISGTNFASTGAVETALEASGSYALGSDIDSTDYFIAIYTDGTNAYVATVTNTEGDDDNDFESGNLTVENIVTIEGLTDLTTLNAANFAFET